MLSRSSECDRQLLLLPDHLLHDQNPGSNTYDPHLDRQKLFNGKQLSTSAQSAYQLAWPFLLWGMLVMILYGISYKQFGDINAGIIAIKMSQLSLAQASRMTYYGARISLEPVSVAD